jgi:hypothetical protein
MINEYFNPNQHLVLHLNSEGAMTGGGYTISNTFPLFVNYDGGDGEAAGNSGGGNGKVESDSVVTKFSSLFKDMGVPAGLFMMPPLFKPRMYENNDNDATKKTKHADEEEDDDVKKTSNVPVIQDSLYDKLLALVSPDRRIEYDNKTRNHRKKSVIEHKKRTTTKKRK